MSSWHILCLCTLFAAGATANERQQSPSVGTGCLSLSLIVEGYRKQGVSFKQINGLVDSVDLNTNENDRLEWRSRYGGFLFTVTGTEYDTYVIRAINLCGGRSYRYDPRVGCLRLEFRNKDELQQLAPWVKRLYQDTLVPAEVQTLCSSVLCKDIADDVGNMSVKRSVAQFLGDFVLDQGTADVVLSVAFENQESGIRLDVLRSLFSVVGEIDNDAREQVRKRTVVRLDALLKEAREGEEGQLLRQIRDKCNLVEKGIRGQGKGDEEVHP